MDTVPKKNASSFSSSLKPEIILPILYIVFVSGYMLYHRAWFAPDQFFAIAIVAVLIIGRIKQFLHDWTPILLFLFGYEYLRGLIPILNHHANTLPMIRADTLIFGFIPTIKLQSILFSGSTLHWYDLVAVLLYISHFIIPMIVAFIFWLHDRNYFKRFMWTFLFLSYLAFVTYVLFPATPPWMASNQGILPPLKKIMDQVLGSFASPISVPSLYAFFGADLVAAFPSLHAAYPWLIFLFLQRKIGPKAVVILPYVFGVWFAVVYLGEHYVIDVIAGVGYATFAYFFMKTNWIQSAKRFLYSLSPATE